MRLLHLADLHLGKYVLEVSMIEDQRAILRSVLQAAVDNKVDAVLIAGDIYDRSVPPAEAVNVLDEFLCELNRAGIAVLAVSGNHDSPERLDFASRLLAERGVHIAGRYDGQVPCVTLKDEFGPVHVYLLPFLKPVMVRTALEEEVSTTDEAVRAALRGLPLDSNERNILVAHQFVCAAGQAPETCDSEMVSVGGSDNVDVSCFDGFDYVALGHLHGAQRMGRETVRYAGSPLKYSLSEVRQHKSMPLVTMGPKGEIEYTLLPLVPLHDLRRLRGGLDELLTAGRAHPEDCEDYIYAVLTDETVLDPAGHLRMVYPNLMHVELEAAQRRLSEEAIVDPLTQKSEGELFQAFYEQVHGNPLSQEQCTLLDEVIAKVKREETL